MVKEFEAFKFRGVQYLAIKVDGGVYILDDAGFGYGGFFDVKSFKKTANPPHVPICSVRLSKQVLDRG